MPNRPQIIRPLDVQIARAVTPELVRLFTPHDNLGRRVQDIANRLTMPALPVWRDELVRDWGLARERVVQVRNALAHGGPIEDESAETVLRFAEQLAAWSLSIALEGVMEGKDVAAVNGEHKQEADRWNEALSSAASVIDALIGPVRLPDNI